jgi:DHA2 family methylenomycin A resistance protein-like MFS transporter
MPRIWNRNARDASANTSVATETILVDARHHRPDVGCMHSDGREYIPMAWSMNAWGNASPKHTILSPVLIIACIGVFLAQLDTSIVNLALRQIGAALNASVKELQWVIDAYNLAYASFLLAGGTLGDTYGRRRLFVGGIALFAAGSLVCGLAPNNFVLIGGRAVSGLGAALAVPTSLAILSDSYPDATERAKAIGIWASCNALAWLVGPAVGGLVVGQFGWRAVFLIVVPIAIVAAVMTLVQIADSRGTSKRAIDAKGQILGAFTLGAFAFGFIEAPHWGWASAATFVCLITALTALVAFVVAERRSHEPLLPLGIFGTSTFAAASAVAAAMTFGMYAMLFLMPLYLQAVHGASTLVVGLQMLPMSIAFFVVSQRSGALVARVGARAMMTTGMAGMGAGLLLLSTIGPHTGLPHVEFAFLIIGIGLGLNTGPVLSVAVTVAPKSYSGTASSVINTARMVGATLGVALLGGLFAMYAGNDPSSAEAIVAGVRPAMLGGAIAEGLGAVLAFLAIPTAALASRGDVRPISASSE